MMGAASDAAGARDTVISAARPSRPRRAGRACRVALAPCRAPSSRSSSASRRRVASRLGASHDRRPSEAADRRGRQRRAQSAAAGHARSAAARGARRATWTVFTARAAPLRPVARNPARPGELASHAVRPCARVHVRRAAARWGGVSSLPAEISIGSPTRGDAGGCGCLLMLVIVAVTRTSRGNFDRVRTTSTIGVVGACRRESRRRARPLVATANRTWTCAPQILARERLGVIIATCGAGVLAEKASVDEMYLDVTAPAKSLAARRADSADDAVSERVDSVVPMPARRRRRGGSRRCRTRTATACGPLEAFGEGIRPRASPRVPWCAPNSGMTRRHSWPPRRGRRGPCARRTPAHLARNVPRSARAGRAIAPTPAAVATAEARQTPR